MGPLYNSRWFQDTIQVSSSFISSDKSESTFLPVIMRRDSGTSPEMGSGKGTRSGNSWFLFLAISCPKKERKVTSGDRSFSAKSVHKETTIQDGDSQVSTTINIGQRLGCLHRPNRCLPTRSDSSSVQEYLRSMFEDQVFQFMALSFRMSPSVDFHQTNGCNSSALASTCHLVISIPRQLAYKRSNSQQTSISHNILPSNCANSRVHSKFKEVRFDTSPEIHVYRDEISYRTKHSQGTSRLHQFSTSDYQTISFSDSSFGTNFPFGQNQCSRRLCSPRQTSLTTASNVSLICLETLHPSSRSSGSNQQYDSIAFEMVDGHQSLHSGNVHSASRSQCISFYRCQSLWMVSSSQANETTLSWLVVRRSNPSSVSIFWK